MKRELRATTYSLIGCVAIKRFANTLWLLAAVVTIDTTKVNLQIPLQDNDAFRPRTQAPQFSPAPSLPRRRGTWLPHMSVCSAVGRSEQRNSATHRRIPTHSPGSRSGFLASGQVSIAGVVRPSGQRNPSAISASRSAGLLKTCNGECVGLTGPLLF